jgi:hypothetical protein
MLMLHVIITTMKQTKILSLRAQGRACSTSILELAAEVSIDMAYQSVQKPTLMTDVRAILDHVCDGVLIWIQTFKPIPYKNIQLFHYTQCRN